MKSAQCSPWFTTLFDSRPTLVTNSFLNTSQLKPRIQMLYQSRNTSRVLWQYALVVPLLAILIGLTAARQQLAETLTIQPGKTITVSGRVVDSQLKPIGGVTIYVQTPTGDFTSDKRGHIERTGGTVKTDQHGRYKLTGLDSVDKLEFIHPAYLVSVLPLKKMAFNGQVRLFTMAEALKLVNHRRARELPLKTSKPKKS